MGELAPTLKIRAHHLLCILGFHGLGYSPEFIAKMGKVVEELSSNFTLRLTFIAECDVICASCPHHKENKCLKRADSEWRVQNQDLEVLQRLGFKVGTHIPVGTAWATVKEKITPEDIVEICRDCEWLELGHCAEGLARLELS